jgi:flagellin
LDKAFLEKVSGMTRINTNVSSLNAQKTLSRNTQALQTALTRLSTGLRINTGKDDPAGMIAAEIMHNNIVAVQKAISNTQRGTQMIATVDSALGSITSLLHDIRSLVTEAGNTAVMSEEQIAANQMQVDAALEAINRIAQVTKFQGRRVLDGSLDFITNANTIPQIRNLKIDQANLGATGQMEVAVEIEQPATRATITTSSGADYATTKLYFSSRVLASGTASGANANLFIAAKSNSQEFDGVQVIFDGSQSNVSATYDAASKTLTIGFDNDTSTIGAILTAIKNTGLFEAYSNVANTAVANSFTNANMAMDYITITADKEGTDYNNVKVRLEVDNALAANLAIATYDPVTKQITVKVTGENDEANYTTLQAITSAINSYLGAYFTATTKTGASATRVYGALASDLATRASTGVSGYLKSAFSDGTRAQATLTFAAGATKTFTTNAGTATIDIKANALGAQAANVVIQFLDDATEGNEYAEYDKAAKSLVVHYKSGSTTVNRIAQVIEATGSWEVVVRDGGTGTVNTNQTSVETGQDTLTVESILPGSNYNNMQVKIVAQTGLSSPVAMYDRATNTFTIKVNYSDTSATTLTAIANAINSVEGFAAYYQPNGIGRIYGNSVDNTVVGNTGASGGNALLDDLVLEVAGPEGMEVFTFYKGTTADQVAAAINAVSDALGLTALHDNALVTLQTQQYGSKQTVAIDVISEGTQGTFARSVSAFRATGTDVQGKINGVTATAYGNKMWINTSMLDITINLAPETDDNFKFTILGGGAQFQLGPDVVTNQQIRMGIKSLNTARLGGPSGKLYQLQTGGDADLYTNPNLAAKIVNEAISVVTELRGRLGALEGLTMQTNIKTMEDTLENMVSAESQIRDADFATETANLTRAQVLVQSGMAVLTIANQNPQNVLALLRNI